MLEREKAKKGTQKAIYRAAKQFLVRFRRRDCCLSVGDVLCMLYVVFCFVTHPTFIIVHVSALFCPYL